jgi:LPXTG-motif cell wall-anchored protein
MLKKVISVSLIMLFLFVSFAGVFANGHKGNGEFIEEEIITQEYKAGVEGVEAIPAKIGYKIKYSVDTINSGDGSWNKTFTVDGEVLAEGEFSKIYDEVPTCIANIKNGAGDKEAEYTFDLENGNFEYTLDNSITGDTFVKGLASFKFTVEMQEEEIEPAQTETVAEDEIIGEKEIYVTGYKITSGKYAGYSVMFAEKVLKCTIKFKIVDGKEEIIEGGIKYTKEWHRLKCLEFGIYVKKTCKWGNGKHLFEYNKWMHKGKYVKVEKEENVVVEESTAGNEESVTVEKESTTSNKKSGKRKDTMISIENNDYHSNGSSGNGSNGSNNSGDSSASDDTTAVNHTVTSNGLPKTGESASANFIFYCVGGLLLMVAGIILFRKKVINKFMK